MTPLALLTDDKYTGGPRFFDATWQSFVMISIAELFDKTFFVALVLALRYNKTTVFVGAFGALLVHTFLAAGAGVFLNRMLTKPIVDFTTSLLYGGFALLYFKDWYYADPDGNVMDGMEEANDELGKYGTLPASGEALKGKAKSATFMNWNVLSAAFSATFMAEMGDRTQIAMIGQHAAQPVIPVIIGSAVAFLQLTLIAVLTGAILQHQGMKERTILATGALSFLFFSLLTLRQGFQDLGYAI